jgi:transposase, IS30 family
MTKKYFQLTLEQRYQIDSLKKAGHTQSAIARIIDCNRSTICNEFRRNIAHGGKGTNLYAAQKAQQKTDLRHKQKFKIIVFSDEMKQDISLMMRINKYSPELISAQWDKDGKEGVSHETIYKWLWECKFGNRKKNLHFKWLHLHLKHSHRRSRRGNYKNSRGLIAHRVSIEKRPAIVDKRQRLGDMEVDLIIGKKHQSGLLVTIDRVTLITTIDKIKSKHPGHIKKLLMKRLAGNQHLKTITFDNDHAFGLHYQIAKELGIKTFFTRPYTSQDKGSIENRNGTIRRFYPKKTDFNEITARDIKRVEQLINNRPIRKYKYKTANEVYLLKSSVALIA